MKIKYSISTICYISWSGLGFIRGIKSYNYNNNKYETKNEPYLYLNSTIYGICGIFLYACPLLLPITIHKELYRLEINIRKLENQKDSSYYNDLM